MRQVRGCRTQQTFITNTHKTKSTGVFIIKIIMKVGPDFLSLTQRVSIDWERSKTGSLTVPKSGKAIKIKTREKPSRVGSVMQFIEIRSSGIAVNKGDIREEIEVTTSIRLLVTNDRRFSGYTEVSFTIYAFILVYTM